MFNENILTVKFNISHILYIYFLYKYNISHIFYIFYINIIQVTYFYLLYNFIKCNIDINEQRKQEKAHTILHQLPALILPLHSAVDLPR